MTPETAVEEIAKIVLSATDDKNNLPNVSTKEGHLLEKVFEMLDSNFSH